MLERAWRPPPIRIPPIEPVEPFALRAPHPLHHIFQQHRIPPQDGARVYPPLHARNVRALRGEPMDVDSPNRDWMQID